jgi:LacI family transcriptional regulator
MSYVAGDFEEQGYQAAALLDRLMDGGEPPTRPVLVSPKQVLVRQSSDVIAVGNVTVARALMFIRRNLHNKSLSASDVVAATQSSRTKLYYEFEEHIGRSIADEIDHLRCQKAAGLLRTTSMKVVRIGDACGFSSSTHFGRSFKRATGLTPTEYRKTHGTGLET